MSRKMDDGNGLLFVVTNTSIGRASGNESAIIYAVIKKLIFLLANELKVSVEFDTRREHISPDLAINFRNDTDLNLTPLWPFYQDWYCFLYANSKKLTFYRSFITTMKLNDYLILAAPIGMTIIYHFLVMRFRLKKTVFDAFWKSYLYSLQTFTNGSIPYLNKYPHDKWFLTGLYIFIFVAMFTFLTFFSSCCTVPRFLPAADHELTGLREIIYTKNFGIGEQCLKEILTGAFERRSCMVSCFRAKSITNNTWHIRITNEINFRNVLKISRNSKYFEKIKELMRIYNENGLFEKLFNEMHYKSYKDLKHSTHNPVLSIDEIRVFILNGYVLGIWASQLSFGIEMIVLFIRRRFFNYKGGAAYLKK